MVIKRVIKSKAAQRKGAISNWKVSAHQVAEAHSSGIVLFPS